MRLRKGMAMVNWIETYVKCKNGLFLVDEEGKHLLGSITDALQYTKKAAEKEAATLVDVSIVPSVPVENRYLLHWRYHDGSDSGVLSRVLTEADKSLIEMFAGSIGGIHVQMEFVKVEKEQTCVKS